MIAAIAEAMAEPKPARRKRSIYDTGKRDLVAAGTHLVATSTAITAADLRSREILLLRITLRPGDNTDVMEALGLVAPAGETHARTAEPGVCLCGWKSVAMSTTLQSHINGKRRK